MKVNEIKDYLNSLYPFDNKCVWDNCGLLVGDGECKVKKIGFALDLTSQVLRDAEDKNVNLIITHHPVIFMPQKTFISGNIAYEAAKMGISVISCHTCYDSADGGVSDILAEKIGLTDIKILETEEKPYCVRIGKTAVCTPEELAKAVASSLHTTVRLAAGKDNISLVAVCGGGGGDFLGEVISSGADAYVTGDISHHQFIDAREAGITLIAAGHYETENPSIYPLMKKVSERFTDAECILLGCDNPVSFVSAEA